jgi:hypothetical protein
LKFVACFSAVCRNHDALRHFFLWMNSPERSGLTYGEVLRRAFKDAELNARPVPRFDARSSPIQNQRPVYPGAVRFR